MRRALLTVTLLLLFVPAAASARDYRETAKLGPVSVRLTYSATTTESVTHFSRPYLTIRRFGRLKVARFLHSGPGDTGSFGPQPGDFFAHKASISIANLDADGAPEVLVDLDTGGAHCCYQIAVFDYHPASGRYARVVGHFLDAGATLRNPDHRGPPEFVSADARFAYAFSSFAASGFPLRIFRFERGGFRPVTREFPKAVRKDAHRWFGYAASARKAGDARGILAAYVADKALLGEAPEALRKVTALAVGGKLGAYAKPGGRTYVRALETFLKKLGYPLG